MYVFQSIQRKVDSIGMYRVVSGGLVTLVIISLLAAAFGQLAYSPTAQITALAGTLLVALSLNVLFAMVLKVPANHESAIITALLLFFLCIPADLLLDNWPLWTATAIAIASKFLITYRKQHIFNPAAFGAAALSVTGVYGATWWVANAVLFVPIVLVGILVVMKVRRWPVVLTMIGAAFVVFMVESVYKYNLDAWTEFQTFWLSWPTVFLAVFMLTEPFTMPPTKKQQLGYGALVGALSSTTLFLPLFVMRPELALLLGNLYAYCFRARRKLFLTLQSKTEVAKDIFAYTFTKPAGFTYTAGQYVEWMLPHGSADSRGPRRYFTIASAPSEETIMLACKHVPDGSSYKAALASLAPQSTLIASQLAGDFTLPADTVKKIGMIAGGIGVTPFVSQVREMQHTGDWRDVAMFYCANTVDELAFADLFTGAVTAAPDFAYTEVIAKGEVATPRASGFVTAELLRERTPDFALRTWYISGPPPMVSAYKKLLKQVGVPARQIKTDFFPGLA